MDSKDRGTHHGGVMGCVADIVIGTCSAEPQYEMVHILTSHSLLCSDVARPIGRNRRIRNDIDHAVACKCECKWQQIIAVAAAGSVADSDSGRGAGQPTATTDCCGYRSRCERNGGG